MLYIVNFKFEIIKRNSSWFVCKDVNAIGRISLSNKLATK
jgi:hypothetical protein